MAPAPSPSLLSHKRERSLGTQDGENIESPEFESSDTDTDEGSGDEWTEGAEAAAGAGRRASAGNTRTGGRRRRPAGAGVAPEGAWRQAVSQQGRQRRGDDSRGWEALPPASSGAAGGAGGGFSCSEPFLPRSQSSGSSSGSYHAPAAGASASAYPQQYLVPAGASSDRMTRSSTMPTLPSSRSSLSLSLSPESLYHRAIVYGDSYSQPPSLSPMTISTPTGFASSFDYGGPSSASSAGMTPPITPISPYATSPGGYGDSYGAQLQRQQHQQYMASSASYHHSLAHQQSHQNFYSSSSQHPEDAHQRSRLKRSHSARDSISSTRDFHQAVVPENGAFLQTRQNDGQFGDAFIGPQTELEAAATMAALAAAKTGAGAGAFVYKVYHMLLDDASQHLISFNAKGTSFVVYNTVQFSRDVLPKYFKHSNFSSFVRQLNMYNFHKVNKTPRGIARAAENQEWEFTHPKFVRGKPHQLEDIKRKAPDAPQAVDLPSLSIPPKMTRSMSGNDIISPRSRGVSASSSAGSGSSSSTGTPGPPRQHVSPVAIGGHQPQRPSPPSPTATSPHPITLPPLAATNPSGEGPYPSPQSMQASPQQFGGAMAPSHQPRQGFVPPSSIASSLPTYASHDPRIRSISHETYATQAIPTHAPSSARTLAMGPSSPIQPLPLPARVQLLEQQRYDLAGALAATQDGYEALYRDLVDSRRREDALVQIVEEIYGVVQTGMPGRLPYQFPSHVFAPRATDAENPLISVTHADPRHQRGSSLQYPPTASSPAGYGEPQFAVYPSFDPPVSSAGDVPSMYWTGQHETLYHPQPQRGDQPGNVEAGYYGSSQPGVSSAGGLTVNTSLAGALLNPHTQTTLAPPPSPGATFINAVNTPLPASPNPAAGGTVGAPSSHGERSQGLVGLGLEDATDSASGRYYERLGLVDPTEDVDVEMASSSLAAFAHRAQGASSRAVSGSRTVPYDSSARTVSGSSTRRREEEYPSGAAFLAGGGEAGSIRMAVA